MHRFVSTPSTSGAAPPAEAADGEAVAARRAMVARLQADGDLHSPAVRDALLAVRREMLFPRAYVRRNAPGAEPGTWQLLDGVHPDDRAEWMSVIHSGASVLVQHNGEPLQAQQRGTVTGGAITGMSSVLSMTVRMLHRLRLQPGLRYLDLGTGPGITSALAQHILGHQGSVTTVESDPHLADAAAERLAALGLPVHVVTGDGLGGCEADGPYHRVLATFAVPRVPLPWLQQLTDGGILVTTLTTRSPSWPGTLTARRVGYGIEATLEGDSSGHRRLHGYRWLTLHQHQRRMGTEPGRRRATMIPPPETDAYGYWLALSYLAPGLLRDFSAEHLTLIAPDDNSWAVVRPDGPGAWQVETVGARDIWAEAEQVYTRWVRAGRPDAYRLEIATDGAQRAHAGHGAAELSWALPADMSAAAVSTPTAGGRS